MGADLTDPHTLFFHVRIFLGMIVSFSLAHLIRCCSRLVDHRQEEPPYWVHLVWVASAFVFLIHFWWWELRFALVTDWTFHVYLFLVAYALLLSFYCQRLLPDGLHGFRNYREFFNVRRASLFGLLALIYVVDIFDAWLKGPGFLASLGPEFLARNIGFIVLSITAIFVGNARFQGAFAIGALVYQLWWIFRMYERLG